MIYSFSYTAEILLKRTDCVDEINLYVNFLNLSHRTDFTDGMCEQTEGVHHE